MNTKVEYISETKAQLKLTVPNKDILPIYVKALEVANITFASGSLPNKDKSQFTEFVKRDVCREVIKNYFDFALKKSGLDPISKVQFDHETWDEMQNFYFTATFEIRPRFSKLHFAGIESVIDYGHVDVSASMVDQTLEKLRAQQQNIHLLPRSAVAEMGTFAVVDTDAYINGVPYPAANYRGFYIELSEANAENPLQKSTLGKKISDEYEFQHEYPKDFQDSKLAGKVILNKVRLIELRKLDSPEMTEEFVSSLFAEGGNALDPASLPKSNEEIRAKVKSDLLFVLEIQKFQVNKEAVLKMIVAQNPFVLPNELLQKQYQALITFETKKFKNESRLTELKDYLVSKESEFLKTAEYLVRTALLIEAFAKKFHVVLAAADFEIHFQKISRLSGRNIDHIRKTMLNPKLKPQVAYSIVEDKVVHQLIEISSTRSKAS